MKISFLKKAFAVIAFWALAFFGGSVVMLWNALAPAMAQYHPGDLGYIVLQTISTAVGAGLAVWAADSITEGKCSILCMVNCVAAATLFATITGLNLLFGGYPLKSMISMGLAICIFVYFAYDLSKGFIPFSKYEDAELVMELFERFAKAQGMTVQEYTTYIRILEKQAAGMDEEDARRVIAREDRERAAAKKKK